MEIDAYITQLANTFTSDVLNFVYTHRNIPILIVPEYSSLYGNVSMFVISLIKGKFRNRLNISARQAVEDEQSCVMIEQIFLQFLQYYYQDYPQDFMNILEAIALIAMYSIYYHLHGLEIARIDAFTAITHMLLMLEEGDFVQRGGLSLLETYAEYLLDNYPEFLNAYQQETYPC